MRFIVMILVLWPLVIQAQQNFRYNNGGITAVPGIRTVNQNTTQTQQQPAAPAIVPKAPVRSFVEIVPSQQLFVVPPNATVNGAEYTGYYGRNLFRAYMSCVLKAHQVYATAVRNVEQYTKEHAIICMASEGYNYNGR